MTGAVARPPANHTPTRQRAHTHARTLAAGRESGGGSSSSGGGRRRACVCRASVCRGGGGSCSGGRMLQSRSCVAAALPRAPTPSDTCARTYAYAHTQCLSRLCICIPQAHAHARARARRAGIRMLEEKHVLEGIDPTAPPPCRQAFACSRRTVAATCLTAPTVSAWTDFPPSGDLRVCTLACSIPPPPYKPAHPLCSHDRSLASVCRAVVRAVAPHRPWTSCRPLIWHESIARSPCVVCVGSRPQAVYEPAGGLRRARGDGPAALRRRRACDPPRSGLTARARTHTWGANASTPTSARAHTHTHTRDLDTRDLDAFPVATVCSQ